MTKYLAFHSLTIIIVVPMNKIFASRLGIFKFIGTYGVLHLAATYISSMGGNTTQAMTITDYINNQKIKQKAQLTLVGIVKPKSVKVARTGLGKQFTLTDHRNQVSCLYQGVMNQQFKQGQTSIVSGYCPNLQQKQKIVVKNVITKHGMDTKQWQSKQYVPRSSYGNMGYAQ